MDECKELFACVHTASFSTQLAVLQKKLQKKQEKVKEGTQHILHNEAEEIVCLLVQKHICLSDYTKLVRNTVNTNKEE